jgi:hypothetical protein
MRAIERITIGQFDKERRRNLIQNAKSGKGRSRMEGSNLIYTVGDEEHGVFEYTVLDAHPKES